MLRNGVVMKIIPPLCTKKARFLKAKKIGKFQEIFY
jgi:hypothetical protein